MLTIDIRDNVQSMFENWHLLMLGEPPASPMVQLVYTLYSIATDLPMLKDFQECSFSVSFIYNNEYMYFKVIANYRWSLAVT
jgi:hypothetical protein